MGLKTLRYNGDQRGYNPDQLVGPDRHGAYYLPVSCDYDLESDRSIMTLKQLTPEELQDVIEESLPDSVKALREKRNRHA